jgi:tRNA U34 2-thiouridine synthase MnmA/TrmU
MFDTQEGKLMVCASSFASCESRFKVVSMAAEKMAKSLNVNVEVKKFKKRFSPIYVYYKEGNDEPIPIYCNNGEKSNIQEIYTTLKNMMFVLSFHPKHSALKQIREEIRLLS